MATKKGIFRPFNPQKYKGDSSNIIFRSGWECKLMMTLDSHPDVLEWSSEEVIVRYRCPFTNKVRRYFPDFWVRKKSPDGTIEEVLIEVKPSMQTKPPKVQRTKTQKPTRKYLNEVKTWGINSAKWKAAQLFCEERGWNFMIMTEKELDIK